MHETLPHLPADGNASPYDRSPIGTHAVNNEIARRCLSTVERLAGYPTRHTLSKTIWHAAEWLADQFKHLPGMEVELTRYVAPAGARVPLDMEVPQVIATLPGRSGRKIILGAHLDSLNLVGTSGPGDFERVIPNVAPGANDDASGIAVLLEAAHQLSALPREHTIVFAAFTGEEQGLLGAKWLAWTAQNAGWEVDAMLNFDTVGSSSNLQGKRDPYHVRVFSEESPIHQSRELARWQEWLTRDAIRHPDGSPFRTKLVFRKDRLARGGDHSPFNDLGFSAVRFTECHEEYSRQHTPDDRPEFIDDEYLACVAQSCVISAYALANSAVAPSGVVLDPSQGHVSRICWQPAPSEVVRVFARETTSPVWQDVYEVQGGVETVIDLSKDEYVFGVASDFGVPVLPRVERVSR